MSTTRIHLFFCSILALASLAAAQGQGQGPGRGQGQRPKPELTAWWDQPIVRDLGLSDEQYRQIRATVAESRDRLIQLRGAVDSAEGELRDAMDGDRLDTRRAEIAIEKVVATHAEMMRAVSQMSLKLRAILTSAQWQELQKRESQPPPPLPGQPQKKKDAFESGSVPLRPSDGGDLAFIAKLFSGPEE
jgi:Spy/CpxP family protein refolding chaperone